MSGPWGWFDIVQLTAWLSILPLTPLQDFGDAISELVFHGPGLCFSSPGCCLSVHFTGSCTSVAR